MTRTVYLFAFLAFVQCSIAGVADQPVAVKSNPSKCDLKGYRLEDLCSDEMEYLDWANAYKDYPRLTDLTSPVLRKIMFQFMDMDKVSALLYLRIIREPKNEEFLNFIERARQLAPDKTPNYGSKNLLFAMVPGMFYVDNPNVGADGKALRLRLEKLGFHTALIPVDQTGTIDANGAHICRFIEETAGRYNGIILGSISKSGADVKRAIQLCGTTPAFQRVTGWLNVAGLLHGSPLVDSLDNDWVMRIKARMYFWWRGYNWDGLQSMRRSTSNPLSQDVEIPRQMRVVNVLPIPIFRFVTERAKPYYQTLLHYGPNDGQTLLAEAYVTPGIIYPSWRNDHYFYFPEPPGAFLATAAYLAGLDPKVARF